MKREKLDWQGPCGWSRPPDGMAGAKLVIAFGNEAAFREPAFIDDLRLNHPYAHLVGCSVTDRLPPDDKAIPVGSALILDFERHDVTIASHPIGDRHRSFAVGIALGRELRRSGLCGLILFSDEENANRAALIAGIANIVGPVPLAGDFSAIDHATASRVVQVGDMSCLATGFGLVAVIGLYEAGATRVISPAGDPRSKRRIGRSPPRPGCG
jgi:hypothetical protein